MFFPLGKPDNGRKGFFFFFFWLIKNLNASNLLAKTPFLSLYFGVTVNLVPIF